MFNSGTHSFQKRTLPLFRAPFCRKDPLSSLTDTAWRKRGDKAYPLKNQQLKGEAGECAGRGCHILGPNLKRVGSMAITLQSDKGGQAAPRNRPIWSPCL